MKQHYILRITSLVLAAVVWLFGTGAVLPSSAATTNPFSPLVPPADCDASKKAANAIVDKLVAGDFEGVRSTFNESLKSNLSAEQMKAIWGSVKNDVGEYKSREKSLYQEYPAAVIVFTRLQMEKGRISVEVHFGEDGKVGGLWVKPA